MSLISEHAATIVPHEQFLLQPPVDLLTLSQCAAIYNGDFEAAAFQITRTAGNLLGVERFSIWLYQPETIALSQIDTYLLSQNCHTSGLSIQATDYPDYFEEFFQRDWLVIHDISDPAQSQTLPDFVRCWLEPRNIQALLEIPIRQAGKVVGTVRCEQVGSPRQWQVQEQACLIAIATLTTLALEARTRTQLEQINYRHHRRCLLIKEILQNSEVSQNPQQLFSQIVTQLGQTFEVNYCQIWAYDPKQTHEFVPIAQYLDSNPSVEVPPNLPDPAFFQPLLDQTLPLLVCNLENHELVCLNNQQSPEHYLALRTTYRGTANGIISLQSKTRWQDDDLSLLQTIAIHVGIILAHHHLLTQEEQQLGTLSRQQQQLQREIIEREQVEQAWQESQRFIQSILDASTNILYVNDYTNGHNFYISRWINNVLGYSPEEISKMGDFLEHLVHPDDRNVMQKQRRKLASLNNGEIIEMEYRLQHRQGNWRWLLCRETVFQRDDTGNPSQIFGTATDITERKQAEEALYEVNRELKRLASIDGLTQVANRRSFDEYLQQEWENLRMTRMPLTLILCDIDYFKRYNDAYGHQAGDVCLQKVAQAINKAVKRSFDLVARYGGEEFAIVLPNTSLEGAYTVVDDIQQEVNALQIPHCQSGIGQYITVSLGIATVESAYELEPKALIAAADRGLYRAKYEGRNRYCLEHV